MTVMSRRNASVTDAPKRVNDRPAIGQTGQDSVEAHPGSEAVPVVWECTGSTVALNDAIRVVRRQGVVPGFYQGDSQGQYPGDEFHHNGVPIVSGQIGNIHSGLSMDALRARSLELALSGQLRLGDLERIVLPIEDVADAFGMLSDQRVLQVALSY